MEGCLGGCASEAGMAYFTGRWSAGKGQESGKRNAERGKPGDGGCLLQTCADRQSFNQGHPLRSCPPAVNDVGYDARLAAAWGWACS